MRALSAVTPGLATWVAEQVFVTPIRHRLPRREVEWSQTARRVTVPSPHGPLAAWVWGEGRRTVLLVHGWAGRGLQLGAFVAPLVDAGFRVVAFDAPAHGASPGRQSNLFRHTDGLVAVAHAFGPIAGVIAHSLGTTAVLLAAWRGHLSSGRYVAIAPMADTRSMAAQFGSMTGFSPDVVTGMRSRLERRLGFRWDDIEPRRLASGVDADTLIIHDHDDRELPAEDAPALADRFGSAELVFTRGLGHRRILRDPEVVHRTIGFLGGETIDEQRDILRSNAAANAA